MPWQEGGESKENEGGRRQAGGWRWAGEEKGGGERVTSCVAEGWFGFGGLGLPVGSGSGQPWDAASRLTAPASCLCRIAGSYGHSGLSCVSG